MKYANAVLSIIGLLIVLCAPAFASVALSSPAYSLYRSGTRIASATSLTDCQAKLAADAAAQGKTSGTIAYSCRADQTATYSANPPPPPALTVTFTANPGTITAGQSSTLSYSLSAAATCTASQNPAGAFSGTNVTPAGSGSFAVMPSITTTYTLTCGPASASAVVVVNAVTPPVDTDGDGVPDSQDACPTVAANTQNGCPVSTPPPTSGNAGVIQGAAETKVVTAALTGSHQTYNVQTEADFDAVPWGTLVAGDVVNIFPGTYARKFGMRAQGTASAPVIINGVSDASGNKPVLNFAGAKTSPNSTNLTDVQYGEHLGGIVVMRQSQLDNYSTYEPKFIVIQGLKVTGARNGASYTTRSGATDNYASSACIWLQSSQDVTLQNDDVSDCGFGIFMMAKDDFISQTNVRTKILNNRVYGNGVSGSYSEHNLYVQGVSPIVDGNYIGQVRSGSQGSSYKSRSSGEINRNNYIVCSALCLDLVQSEEQRIDGVVTQPDYGTDYVYGNTIISGGQPVIHYGGDNKGEQDSEGVTATVFVPPVPYRKHLRFWNNNIIFNDQSDYKAGLFRLSALETEASVWNDKFTITFNGPELSWLTRAGTLNLGPGNTFTKLPVQNVMTGTLAPANVVNQNAPIPSDPRLATLQ